MADVQEIADRLREKGASEGSKLSYFLMGVAGSAIAFAFHETADRHLSWSLIPIGLSCLSWGYSFACGIYFAENNIKMSNDDYKIALALFNGVAVPDQVHEEFEKKAKHGSKLFYRQLRTLLLGALLYALGHVAFIATPHLASSSSSLQSVPRDPR